MAVEPIHHIQEWKVVFHCAGAPHALVICALRLNTVKVVPTCSSFVDCQYHDHRRFSKGREPFVDRETAGTNI